MVGIRLTVTRASDGADVDGLIEALGQPQPALEALGEVWLENIEQRFQTQTDPWGGAWEPHTAVTVELQAARGRLGKILQQTRVLANSKYARVVDGHKLLVGFGDSLKARVHQFGNPANRMFGRAKAPIPARPMLPLRAGRLELPADLREELIETFRDVMLRMVRAGRNASHGG